jgi:hypothetical protein
MTLSYMYDNNIGFWKNKRSHKNHQKYDLPLTDPLVTMRTQIDKLNSELTKESQTVNEFLKTLEDRVDKNEDHDKMDDTLYVAGYEDGYKDYPLNIDLTDNDAYYLGFQDGSGDRLQEVRDRGTANDPYVADIHSQINDLFAKKNDDDDVPF